MLELEAYWATEGLDMIAQAVSEFRGHTPSKYGSIPLLTGNSGEPEYENDTFVMRSYCWCDLDRTGHEDGCPPNFIYKVNGLTISWYKHANRGIVANMKFPGMLQWSRAVTRCIESVYAKEP